MFANDFPFSHLPPFAVVWCIGTGRRQNLDNVHCSTAMKGLIEECWSADPAYRPSFTEILKELQHTVSPFVKFLTGNHFVLLLVCIAQKAQHFCAGETQQSGYASISIQLLMTKCNVHLNGYSIVRTRVFYYVFTCALRGLSKFTIVSLVPRQFSSSIDNRFGYDCAEAWSPVEALTSVCAAGPAKSLLMNSGVKEGGPVVLTLLGL